MISYSDARQWYLDQGAPADVAQQLASKWVAQEQVRAWYLQQRALYRLDKPMACAGGAHLVCLIFTFGLYLPIWVLVAVIEMASRTSRQRTLLAEYQRRMAYIEGATP